MGSDCFSYTWGTSDQVMPSREGEFYKCIF